MCGRPSRLLKPKVAAWRGFATRFVEKRSQLFVRAHNETLFVAAMRVCDKDPRLETQPHVRPAKRLESSLQETPTQEGRGCEALHMVRRQKCIPRANAVGTKCRICARRNVAKLCGGSNRREILPKYAVYSPGNEARRLLREFRTSASLARVCIPPELRPARSCICLSPSCRKKPSPPCDKRLPRY